MKNIYNSIMWYARAYARYIYVCILTLVTLFVIVSLYTFQITDSSWCYYKTGDPYVANGAGFLGAHLAALLFYLLGGVSLLLIPILVVSCYMIACNKSFIAQGDRFIASGLCIGICAALLHVYAIDVASSPLPGGYVGYTMHLLAYRYGAVYGLLLLYLLLGVAMMVLMRISYQDLYCWCRQFAGYVTSERFTIPMYHLLQTALWIIARPCVWLYQATYCLYYDKETLYELSHAEQRRCENCFTTTFSSSHFKKIYEDTILENGAHIRTEEYNEHPEEYNAQKEEQEPYLLSRSTEYALPNLNIFIGNQDERDNPEVLQHLQERAHTLEQKLQRFGVSGKIVSIKRGPVVTLFEYQPEIDSKISKIVALEDDLALALQALSIRIIAPIPGRPVVGFEVSNTKRKMVSLAEVLRSETFDFFNGQLPLALGQDTVGNNVIVDLARMPHLLIAGSTGSGKSVALNAMLVSLLCKLTPDELRLVLIDPKRLEFSSYADIAHLLFPIITHPKRAIPVLKWVVHHMEERYEQMAQYGARNIQDFNMVMQKIGKETLPFIVVIIDELADLMMTTGRDIEELIARITQMARASGIHLIVATQRPSVDVITGLIKVNFPSRISFRVTSKIDSRTILDCGGADKLLGRGDMLFLDSQDATLKRLHGAYVSDQEIDQLVMHIKKQREVEYLPFDEDDLHVNDSDRDEIYTDVLQYLEEIEEISISLLQRKFRIGYNRSARIIDMLEAEGLISASGNSKTRSVIR